MAKHPISKPISKNSAIEAALQLDGDPENLRSFYEGWAENYNLDTSSSDYVGPKVAAKLVRHHVPSINDPILDAGCGTGLVGVELQQLGFSEIDGFDLSDSMAQQAIATHAYRQVEGGVDMMSADQYYGDLQYDSVVSIGVFTLGHVPPQALQVLLRLLRPNGCLVVSTRSHYYEQTEFRQVVEEEIEAKRASLIQVIKNAPYNEDGNAHYWVFKNCSD